jgi:hypothetical protein
MDVLDALKRAVGFEPPKKAPTVFEIDVEPYKVRISDGEATLQCQGVSQTLIAVRQEREESSTHNIPILKDAATALKHVYLRLSQTYLDSLSLNKDISINDLCILCKMSIKNEMNRDGSQLKLTIHFLHETLYFYFEDPDGIQYPPITETINDRKFSFSRRQITTSGWSFIWGQMKKYKDGQDEAYAETMERNPIIDEIYFALNTQTAESKSRTILRKKAVVVGEMDLCLTFTIETNDHTRCEILVGFLERGDETDLFDPVRTLMHKNNPLKRNWRFNVTSGSTTTSGFGRISNDEHKYEFEIWTRNSELGFPRYQLHFIKESEEDQLNSLRSLRKVHGRDYIPPENLIYILDTYFPLPKED